MINCRSHYLFKTDLSAGRLSGNNISINRLGVVFTLVLILASAVYAQSTNSQTANGEVVVVEGVNDSTVFGLGRSLKITGTVKQGALAFGGDIIVEGTVEGDVATIGGSVIQRDGSRIGGDVIVLGGAYRPGDKPPNRNPGAMTMMYAGYEQELRDIMRNPAGLLRPGWSLAYVGTRLLVVLFWFVVCLALTAAMPGTISRGVARLQLTSLRVALIGLAGVVVLFLGVSVCLWILPETVGVIVGLMALLFGIVSALFGRVILYAATGRWLQRKYVRFGRNSEAVALLLGTIFWVTLASLPYIWPFVVCLAYVISFGLALTARYRVGWTRTVPAAVLSTQQN
jgi:hypothetical protein